MKRKPKKSYFTGPARAVRKKLRKPQIAPKSKRIAPKSKRVSRNGKLPSQGKPKPSKPQQRIQEMAAEKAEKAEKADKGKVSGMIRNLENTINSKSSAPPDPELAAQFDAIQAALAADDEEGNGGKDKGNDHAKKK